MRLNPRGFRRNVPIIVLAGCALAVAASNSGGVSALAGAYTSVDSPEHSGAVVVIDAVDQEETLARGTGSTAFTLRLPADATCPGDSAHDQWRIQSFVVPTSVDPGSLRYELIGPSGDGFYALYGTDTVPYMQQFTLPNDVAGEPGVIPPVAPLSFEVFPAGTLPDGHYRIGIACTYFRETAKYWDAEIDVHASADADPADLSWSVVGQATETGGSVSSPTWLLVGSAIVLSVLGVMLVALRHRRAIRYSAPRVTPSPISTRIEEHQ